MEIQQKAMGGRQAKIVVFVFIDGRREILAEFAAVCS
jgi:hypothetical protein